MLHVIKLPSSKLYLTLTHKNGFSSFSSRNLFYMILWKIKVLEIVFGRLVIFRSESPHFLISLLPKYDTAKHAAPPITFVYCFGLQNLRRHKCAEQ